MVSCVLLNSSLPSLTRAMYDSRGSAFRLKRFLYYFIRGLSYTKIVGISFTFFEQNSSVYECPINRAWVWSSSGVLFYFFKSVFGEVQSSPREKPQKKKKKKVQPPYERSVCCPILIALFLIRHRKMKEKNIHVRHRH